jgi:hypothetical protein
MVAIPATSMLVIRLDAMHHFWRQSSGSVDLDQPVSGGAPGARGGVALSLARRGHANSCTNIASSTIGIKSRSGRDGTYERAADTLLSGPISDCAGNGFVR